METKTGTIANLNCTFGNNNDSLLDHFIDVFYPSLVNSSKIKDKLNSNNNRKGAKSKYLIRNIKLHDNNGELILSGLIIKDTTLEIRSVLNKEGQLELTNIDRSVAPYSIFQLFLRNHRMILVRNQAGSPNIRNFYKAIKDALNNYIEYKEINGIHLPKPVLSVIPIQHGKTVGEMIKDAYKVNRADFTFKPLNQDIDNNSLNKAMRKSLDLFDSKNVHYLVNSPKDQDTLSKMVKDGNGKVSYNIKTTNASGEMSNIKNDSSTKKVQVSVTSDNPKIMSKDIYNKIHNNPSIRYTTSTGYLNYKKNFKKIKKLMNKN